MKPDVKACFDDATNTATYVVSDSVSKRCAVIDPVLDYDAASGRTSTNSVAPIVRFIRSNDLKLDWIIETHVHADHLTSAPYLREVLGGQVVIGERVTDVQAVFKDIFNIKAVDADGSQFDRLVHDGETLEIGGIKGHVISTPGHTPACCTYVFGDAAFIGDTMFMPDSGTARCDFPGGDAASLYDSIMKILALPADTRLFICHDYKGQGRENFEWETTVAEQRENNIHIGDGVSREEFIEFRKDRDSLLSMPKLILPSIQVNIRAGELPSPEDNNISYIKIPLNTI